MARGKYATRADRMSQYKEVVDDVEAQRRTITRLTAENKKLRDHADSVERTAKKSIGKAQAQLQAGTSDALEAAQRTIRELRDELGEANAYAKDIRRKWKLLLPRLADYIATTEGMPRPEAYERVVSLVGGESVRVDWDDTQKHGLHGEAVERIQRARGMRR